MIERGVSHRNLAPKSVVSMRITEARYRFSTEFEKILASPLG